MHLTDTSYVPGECEDDDDTEEEEEEVANRDQHVPGEWEEEEEEEDQYFPGEYEEEEEGDRYVPGEYEDEEDTRGSSEEYLALPPSPFASKPLLPHKPPNLIRASAKDDLYVWSNKRHRCRHHKNLDIPDTVLVDSTCVVLSFLEGMYLCCLLWSLVCPKHNCIIPFSELLHHIEKHHKILLRICGIPIEVILAHIQLAFLIAPLSTVDTIVSKVAGIQLSEPIPGLDPLELCVQCPICKHWFVSRDGKPGQCLYQHLTTKNAPVACREWHKGQPKAWTTKLPRVYTGRLFKVSSRGGFRIVFHPDFKP